MDQQPAPVNNRYSRAQIGHSTGEPAGHSQPVGVLSERPQASQRDDLVGLIIAVIADRFRRATLHLTGAFHPSLLVCLDNHKFAGTERICRVRT